MPVWIVGTSDLNRSGNSLASSRAIGSGALWLPTKTNRNIPQDGTNKLPFQCLPDRRNSPSCLSRKGSDLNSSNIEAVFDSSDCAPCRQGGARIKKHSLGVNRTSAIADEIAVALTVVNERKGLISIIIKSCATLRLKWLQTLVPESLSALCVAGVLRSLRSCFSTPLVRAVITGKSLSLVHDR